MGFDSPVHWIIVIGVIALLFGGSRVGNVMGELGKGIKSFKQNLAEHDPSRQAAPQTVKAAEPPARVAEAMPPPMAPAREPEGVARRPEVANGADQTRL